MIIKISKTTRGF